MCVCVCVCVCMLVAQLCPTLCDPMDSSSSSVGLPFPSSGDLPNPGIEPGSTTLQADSLPFEPLGSPWSSGNFCKSSLLLLLLVDRGPVIALK